MFKFKPTKREITSAEAYLMLFVSTAFGMYTARRPPDQEDRLVGRRGRIRPRLRQRPY